MTTTTKERPIIFSAQMVQAILAGRKSQTRRAVNPKPDHFYDGYSGGWECATSGKCYLCGDENGDKYPCPYGSPGEKLWVREAVLYTGNLMDETCRWVHEADCDDVALTRKCRKRCSSMFMPRWLSRLTLEITGVRVERVQDISEADAIAEGCIDLEPADIPAGWTWSDGENVYVPGDAFQQYMRLWESINGPGSWAANPWVWVIEFKRIDPAA
jgi:hypothetical protein